MFKITLTRGRLGVDATDVSMPAAFKTAIRRFDADRRNYNSKAGQAYSNEMCELFAQARASLAYRPATLAVHVTGAHRCAVEIRRVEE